MKPFLLITGMHRSGTSFLARALNLCGAYLGELDSLVSHEWKPMKDNPKGHWENKNFLTLTEKTLETNGGSWDNPPHKISINKNLGEEIQKTISDFTSNSYLAVGFKDPRIILVYDSWKSYLPKDSIVIAIFRHPLKVAESLKKRNGFDYEKSLELWKKYNTELLKILENQNSFLINFDWPKEKLLAKLYEIIDKIGLPRVSLDEWYSKEILQSDLSYQKDYALSDDIKSLYALLEERSSKNEQVTFLDKRRNAQEAQKIISTLLFDIKNQGNYFKSLLNEKTKLLETLSKSKDPISELMSLYFTREDLQKAYPEALQGEYQNLIGWARMVISGKITNEDEVRNVISKYSKQYEAFLLQNQLYDKVNSLQESVQKINAIIDSRALLEKSLNQANLEKQQLQNDKTSLERTLNQANLEKQQLLNDKTNLRMEIDRTQQMKNELLGRKDSEIIDLKQKISRLSVPPYDPVELLKKEWNRRADLQANFPEAGTNNLDNLIKWAAGVVLGEFDDTSYDTLRHYGGWYVYQAYKRGFHGNEKFKGENKLSQTKKIATKSLEIIRKEGLAEYLSHVNTKISRKEFRLAEQKKKNAYEITPILKSKASLTSNEDGYQAKWPNDLEQTENDQAIVKRVDEYLRKNCMSTLLSTYKNRQDLQRSYPDVSKGDYSGLFSWARSIANGHIKNEQEALKSLSDFISWYQQNIVFKNSSPTNSDQHSNYYPDICANIISHFEYTPKVSIIMPIYNSTKIWLEKAISSIVNQLYDNWELCIVDDFSTENHIRDILEKYSFLDERIKVKFLDKNTGIVGASNEAIKLATGEFLTFLDHDDEFTPDALYEIIKLLNIHRDAEIVYTDDAKKDENGKIYDHQFKPDWSPELLLSYSYLSHIVTYRKELIDKLGGLRKEYEPSQDYDLMLRATELTNKIYHIPKVLYYWRSIPTSTAFSVSTKPDSIEAGRSAVEDALKRRNVNATVVVPDFAKNKNGVYKIKFNLTDKPLVSIIIPTKDKLQLLKNCINSIETINSYKNYEIIIVDTGTTEKEALAYLKNSKHKVIRLNMEKFNFSRANNVAALQAKGSYLLLANNDIEIISPNSIEEMIGYMDLDSKIGIVGGKLLYKDKKTQHAGVILGLNNGLAGHANKLKADWDPGYLMYASVARDYSAVTAAFMMIKKEIYQIANGFDETNFALSYNDVDFCLRAYELGYRTVYTPYALAYHYEGSTKGTGLGIDDPKEEEHLRQKWPDKINRDPFYNPNLSLKNESFEIKSFEPTIKRVLLVSHNLNYEGAPISLSLLASGLKNRNYETIILSPKDGPLKYDYLSNGIDVYINEEFFSNPDNGIDFVKRFDMIIVNTIVIYPIVSLAKMANIPVMWFIRESEREHYMKEGIDEDQFKNATKVVFVSNATRKIYSDLEFNDNFITIPNALDMKKVDSFRLRNSKSDLRKKHGFSDNDRIITVIGTVAERKGQLDFAKAAAMLLEKNTNNLVFLIVGAREGNYLKSIKNFIDKSGYSNKIKLIPETKSVFDYYLISDIFVCTSYIESSPRVILEAMAFKLPIISTNVFGIPEQIENDREGILIEPGNPAALAKKISYLIENQKTAKKFAEQAYVKVRNQHSVDSVITMIENKIKELQKLSMRVYAK